MTDTFFWDYKRIRNRIYEDMRDYKLLNDCTTDTYSIRDLLNGTEANIGSKLETYLLDDITLNIQMLIASVPTSEEEKTSDQKMSLWQHYKANLPEDIKKILMGKAQLQTNEEDKKDE